jgi:hypothetical protein
VVSSESSDIPVSRLFKVYLSKPDWVTDVERADAIFVAAHSQGCIVAAHLLARMIENGHIHTSQSTDRTRLGAQKADDGAEPMNRSRKVPRVILSSFCGVHLGPFYNSATSTVITPYLWFEHPSARRVVQALD